MAILKKQFTSDDAYQKWLHEAGQRIQVLTVSDAAAFAGGVGGRRNFVVTYRATDRDLQPRRHKLVLIVEAMLMVAVLAALATYTRQWMNPPPQQLLKLDPR